MMDIHETANYNNCGHLLLFIMRQKLLREALKKIRDYLGILKSPKKIQLDQKNTVKLVEIPKRRLGKIPK